MASLKLKNTLSSLIPGLDSDLFIGVHFDPTDEEAIRIVTLYNEGKVLLPIFEVRDHLFQLPPEQVGECYCLTKLEPLAKNKVKRKLGDRSGRFWKNINKEKVVVNEEVIGSVTKLVLQDKGKRPTEWHIWVYMDTEAGDGRYVLCRIYKTEKKNDSGAGQFYPSTSQDSSMWNNGASQVQHYEMGQCSNTQFSDAATYAHLTGEHMNQVQHYEMGQFSNTQPDWFHNSGEHMNQVQHYEMGQFSNTQPDWFHNAGEHMNHDQIPVNNPQQFTSNTTSSIGGADLISGFVLDNWNEIVNQLGPEF